MVPPHNPTWPRWPGSSAGAHSIAASCWYLRHCPLLPAAAKGFYASNDISVRMENGQFLANTLSDLTRRECRFAHPNMPFPFDARYWGQLGLPTLRECSDPNWIAGNWSGYSLPTASTTVDFWSNGTSPSLADNALVLFHGSRIADDVILTNVIGFDVKAWDPGDRFTGCLWESNYAG